MDSKINIYRKQLNLTVCQVSEMEKWINKSSERQIAVKCQALISISKGNSISSVCKLFGINRETLRQWQRRVVQDGINGLNPKPGKGRKSKLTPQLTNDLKIQLLKMPIELGYQQEQWDGKLVCNYLSDFHKQSIALRTAQNYLKILRLKEGFTK